MPSQSASETTDLLASVAAGTAFTLDDGRSLSATLLREVVLRDQPPGARWLWLRSVHIDGALDLRACEIGLQLRLEGCTFSEGLDLRQLKAPNVTFQNCVFEKGVQAQQLEIHWNLVMEGCTAKEGIDLENTVIGGFLSLNATKVWKPAGHNGGSLNLGAASIQRGLLCRQLEATGPVILMDAKVGRQVAMNDVRVEAAEEDPQRISLYADRLNVEGGFFFPGAKFVGGIRLSGATIGGQLVLRKASLEVLRDEGAQEALSADGITISADLVAQELTASGEIRMLGATIGGGASLARSRLNSVDADDIAFSADRLRLSEGFNFQQAEVNGEIRLLASRIGGQMNLRQAQVISRLKPDGSMDAVSLDTAEITGDLICSQSKIVGTMRLPGAKLRGDLRLNGAELKSGETADALAGDEMEVAGNVLCDGLSSGGEIRFAGCTISGGVLLQQANLSAGDHANALVLDGGTIGQGIIAIELKAKGEVRMIDTEVVGNVSLRQAELSEPDDYPDADAISLDNSEIKGSLLCEKAVVAGSMRLPHLSVRGHVSLEGAVLNSPPAQEALLADGLTVTASVQLNMLDSRGTVRLNGATIDGQLALVDAQLASSSSNLPALTLIGARIDQLVLAPGSTQGAIDLRQVNVRSLWDAQDGAFIRDLPDELLLDGLTYQSIREPLPAKDRLGWLAIAQKQRFYPGSYLELAKFYNRVGLSSDARRVLIARERRATKEVSKWSPRRTWRNFLWVTIGNGYRNWLAGLWLLGVVAAGTLAFAMSEGDLVPLHADHPDFNPFLYAIDVTIPVLDLGQQSSWAANGAMAWVVLALSVSGYALATAVIAAAAGLLDRDDA
jgi:hypothetical protein